MPIYANLIANIINNESNWKIINMNIMSMSIICFFDDILENSSLVKKDDSKFLDTRHFQEEFVFSLRNNFCFSFILLFFLLFHFRFISLIFKNNTVFFIIVNWIISIVFNPSILSQNLKNAVYEVYSTIFECKSFFVLEINFYIFSKITTTVDLNL